MNPPKPGDKLYLVNIEGKLVSFAVAKAGPGGLTVLPGRRTYDNVDKVFERTPATAWTRYAKESLERVAYAKQDLAKAKEQVSTFREELKLAKAELANL